jgi:uncharacterized membrane protein
MQIKYLQAAMALGFFHMIFIFIMLGINIPIALYFNSKISLFGKK